MLSHSGAKVVLVEDAAQAAKIAAVRGALGELEHVVVLTGEAEGAITLADLRSRGDAGDRRSERIAVDRPRGHGDDRLHLRHDGAAQGLRALAREPALHRGHLHRPPEPARQAAGDLPVPAAGARAGADGLLRHASRPAARWPSGAGTRRTSRPTSPRPSRATSPPCRGCWRRSTPASSAPPRPPAAPRPRSSPARWPPARRWPRPSARAARSARSTRPATPSATSSRSRRSATRSAPTTRC